MKRRSFIIATQMLATLLLAWCAGCADGTALEAPQSLAPEPSNAVVSSYPAIFTATRQINDLNLAPDGTLWAATAGGVLRGSIDGVWHKWTKADGLPAHEVGRITFTDNTARAQTPHGSAVFKENAWHTTGPEFPSSKADIKETPHVLWRGVDVSGRSELKLGTGKTAQTFPLPPGRGSHISALVAQDKDVWAALYGDGIWSFDGAKWKRLEWRLPEGAREITALAGRVGDVWVGTRQNGIWHFDGEAWLQYLQDGEPYEANIQNMAAYKNQLWCSTLESGLVYFDGMRWRHVSAPTISSDAPRQIARFAGGLWVQHGGGVVDMWDGFSWKCNVFSALPRGKASALAADAQRLYIGQWGGWSEWDGHKLTHKLSLPELQGLIVLSLLPDGDNVWIGTQHKGLAYFNRAAGTVTWVDERDGLQDDWITTIAKSGNDKTGVDLCAGTFVGGLALKHGDDVWRNVPELQGRNVTAIAADTSNNLFVATRTGIWQRRAVGGKWVDLSQKYPRLDTEAQALCPAASGMWVGTRTAIFFVPNLPSESQAPA